MVRRQNNQLPENLPQLQNLIKRDPQSYHEEFLQQYRHFQNTVEIFQLTTDPPNKMLDDLVMFLAQVSHCYPKELSTFPQQLIVLLEKRSDLLNNNTRMTFCRALILLRNKNLLSPMDLLQVFFKLIQCQDKQLRTFLETSIIADIKNITSKQANGKLNTAIQNFMFNMLKDNNSKVAKMSVNILIELYKKNIWNDAKTVNVIATGCFSKFVKVMVASVKFFLGKDPEDPESDNSDSDMDVDPREIMNANKVNKKTRKRGKQLTKVKKLAANMYKKKAAAPSFNFSALHLIYDPQGMAEKLFHQLTVTNKRFEIKMISLDIISRLIGLHQLFLLNFYPYIQRFFQPHQREVTRILQFAAQSSHELVPPDVMDPLLKSLANNFITESNSSDVMAIGLNAVREICVRCPLAMDDDLLRDLAMYKSYKDKSVMMAARSLIHTFRITRPELLHKKDRGRPMESSEDITLLRYGQISAKDYVSGAEVLLNPTPDQDAPDSDSDNSWIDVEHGDNEDGSLNSEDVDDDSMEAGSDSGDKKAQTEQSKNDIEQDLSKGGNSLKIELAQKVTIGAILSDEDFKRIDMANLSKHVNAKKSFKRKLDQNLEVPSEFVKLGDIENIHKKRKHDKMTRIDSVKSGQMNREKYGYKDGRVNVLCSKTNKEKRKSKVYQMIKHKVQQKVKRSFRDKQVALRNHLLKLKRMK